MKRHLRHARRAPRCGAPRAHSMRQRQERRAAARRPRKASTDVSGNVSIVGVWTGDEQKHSRPCSTASRRSTRTSSDVQVDRRQHADGALDRGAGRQPARPGGRLAARPRERLPEEGRAQDDRLREAHGARELPGRHREARRDQRPPVRPDHQGANKSTVWYNVKSFKDAGVKAPTTWDDVQGRGETMKASGMPAYSIGGADGWTLTDLFENIYLRQAGADEVRPAVEAQDQVDRPVGQEGAEDDGRRSSATARTSPAARRARCRPTSRRRCRTSSRRARRRAHGDRRRLRPRRRRVVEPAEAGHGYNVFAVPVDRRQRRTVVGGGDELMMFKDTPAIRALVKYLATGEAQTIWAKLGGYSAPAKTVDASAYPDDITRTTATRDRQGRRRSGSTSPTSSRRRSAARSARVSSRSSRTS